MNSYAYELYSSTPADLVSDIGYDGLGGRLLVSSSTKACTTLKNRTIEGDGLLAFRGALTLGPDVHFPGRVVLYAYNGLTLQPNTRLDNVLIFCRSNLTVAENCQIRGVVFVRGSAKVSSDVQLSLHPAAADVWDTPSYRGGS